jgi:2-oxoglutarate dehydrogenase E1 component
MAADDAFVVAQPSTPASYFHLLRRHALGEEHRPLIVFTRSRCSSARRRPRARGLHGGLGFHTVTPDAMVDPEKVRTLLLCSGRITWDLMVERGKRQGDELTTAIARVEQLYPHPTAALKAEIARYPNLEHVRWVQDEPVNMGPSPFYRLNVFADLATEGHEVEVISRPASSSPSVGQHSRHVEEQKSVLERAFA